MIGLGQALTLALAPQGVLTPPFAGPLDAYTEGLAGAWSVSRRLLSDYTGPIIRVRRESDNAEKDIGHDNDGWMDVDDLMAFAGIDSAFVTKIYDQNLLHGYNQSQANASLQPVIVASGVMQTGAGGKPMANFLSSGRYMDSGCPAITTNLYTCLAAVNGLTEGARYAGGNTYFTNHSQRSNDGTGFRVEAFFAPGSTVIVHSNTALVAFKRIDNSPTIYWQFDGSIVPEVDSSTTSLNDGLTVTGMFVINDGNLGGHGTGKISELFTYNIPLSDAYVAEIQAIQEGLNCKRHAECHLRVLAS